MSVQIATQLQEIAAAGGPVTPSRWKAIIDEMISEFEGLIGAKCERDGEARLTSSSSFSIWMWSPLRPRPVELEISWSAVMAGGPVAENGFAATVTLFAFDSRNMTRLIAADGRSFIEYEYARDGKWCNRGWMEDEWGEWSGIAYPDREGG